MIDEALIDRVYRERRKDFLYISSLIDYVGSGEILDISRINKIWKDHLRSDKKKRLYFYLNIPFCRQKCHYCEFVSGRPRDEANMERYIDKMVDHFRYFKDTFKNQSFENVYIGGGTPSILSDGSIERLLSELFNNFRFDDDGMKSCELNPASSSLSKLQVLKRYGFNRVSFGVQSFEEKVLSLNNREYQDESLVKGAINDARKAGFIEVNTDLMFGLYGDDNDKFMNSLRKAIDLRPHSICVYLFHPNEGYLDRFGLKADEYFDMRRDRLDSIREKIKDMADSNGYEFPLFNEFNFDSAASGCFYLFLSGSKTERNPTKAYTLESPHGKNYSVLGIGPFSMSRTDDGFDYRTLGRPGEGSFYEHSVNSSKSREAMIKFILLSMCHGKQVSDDDFFAKFGCGLFGEFSEELKELTKRGLMAISNKRVLFNTDDYEKRFLSSLFFLSQRHLKALLDEDYIDERDLSDLVDHQRGGISKATNQRLDRMSNRLNSMVEGKVSDISDETVTVDGRLIELREETVHIEICKSDDEKELYKKELTKGDIEKGDGVSIFHENGVALVLRRIVSARTAIKRMRR